MDEILASIRRIIESGDERPAGAPVAGPERTLEVSVPAEAGARPTPSEFNPRHPPAAEEQDDYDVEDDLRALSEVEIDIDDGHAPEAHAGTGHPEAAPAAAWTEASPGDDWTTSDPSDAETEAHGFAASPPPVAENENAAREPAEDAEPSETAAAARNFSFEFDDEAFEAALRSDAWHEPAPPVSPPAREPDPAPEFRDLHPAKAAMPEKAEMPESVIEGASALLSAQAGDQVAAAFDSLTHAIRDGQMRSMEDMAREMLRPMLCEWLDDNLPRLVERLVRDEIERIARGPHR